MKRYINYSIIYAVLALVGGVFYREFTKMNGYTAWTSLSVVHTHYFILGMMFFLILGLVSFNVNFKSNRAVLFYNVGLKCWIKSNGYYVSSSWYCSSVGFKYSICSYFWHCRYWSYYSGCFINSNFIGYKKERLSSFSLPLTCRLGKCLARMYLRYS